jgi:FlaG/FlaF family flagellin (archaellin)
MIKKRRQKNQKGLSDVVSIVLFLALVVVMVGIVWAVVNGLVKDKLSQAGSCFDISGKVTINGRYTCYNSTSNELQFSLSVGDINIDEILVGISASGTSVSFKINSGSSQVTNLFTYPGRSINVTLPKKNAGLTYILNMSGAGFQGVPDSMRIAPIVGEEQCETSDSVEEIDNCQLLVQ